MLREPASPRSYLVATSSSTRVFLPLSSMARAKRCDDALAPRIQSKGCGYFRTTVKLLVMAGFGAMGGGLEVR